MSPKSLSRFWLVSGLTVVTLPALAETQGVNPKGEGASTKTQMLEAGAALLQTDDVFDHFDVYLDGFHAMKDDANHQMEAHHFCSQVNQDFAQRVLFDGNSENANLNGVEYIISEQLFNELPQEEKKFWHPHNYEILSGALIAPGLPQVASMPLFEGKMNSYGKTWHFWKSGGNTTTGTDRLPLGDPMLAWSFNKDGEMKMELLDRRDQRMDIQTEEIRRERQQFVQLAHPQEGVDAMAGKFDSDGTPIAGVENKPSQDQGQDQQGQQGQQQQSQTGQQQGGQPGQGQASQSSQDTSQTGGQPQNAQQGPQGGGYGGYQGAQTGR